MTPVSVGPPYCPPGKVRDTGADSVVCGLVSTCMNCLFMCEINHKKTINELIIKNYFTLSTVRPH